MPYDFYKMKKYSVDYLTLLNSLLSNPIFLQSPLNQKQYITKWISVLQRYDESIVKIMNDPKEFRKYLDAKQSEPEVFQIPIYVESNTLLVSVNCDRT